MFTSLQYLRPKGRERGSAVLVILVLLACMAALMESNSRTLALLKQELQLLDQRQTARLGAGHVATNNLIFHGQGPGH